MANAGPSTAAAANDTTALEIFQNQWEVYQKFLQYDYLSNAEACAALHRFLVDDVARPFRFIDLACGDISGIVGTLRTTPIEHYRGVDLSGAALALAADNLPALPCPAELDEADFTVAMRDLPQPADIVWISLSLHHLDTAAKGAFMREVREGLGPRGAFLAYEPTRRDGEDRPAYLDRFEAIGRRDWINLSGSEFTQAMRHVRACDLPETVAGWSELGQAAGFASTTQLYRSPTDLFRLYLFRP
jgi:SAM-dependent methyltransferase